MRHFIQQILCPSGCLPAVGSSGSPQANGGALGKLSKWRYWRVKPPSTGCEDERWSAGAEGEIGGDKPGAAARGMALRPWRGRQSGREKWKARLCGGGREA